MASLKEIAANIAAAAKSGKDKTTALLQEKVEKLTAHSPVDKEMAEQKKLEKLEKAEFDKQEAIHRNALARERARAASSTTSALPGHGSGKPAGGNVVGGVVESHPIGTATGTGRPSAAHNSLSEGGQPKRV